MDEQGDRRLRVLTLVDDIGTSGGGERFAMQVTLSLDSDRFERILCVTRWSPERAADLGVSEALAELDRAGVRFLALNRTSPRKLLAWRPLIELLRDEPIDVLHTHKFGSNFWGAVFSTFGRIPVFVAHEQTWSFEGRPVRRFLDRELIARRADAFIAVSSADRQRMIELEGIPADMLVIMPNAIPTPPASEPHDLRGELGLEPGDPIIGAVCVLRRQKALDVLLEAAAIVRRRVPRLHLVIVGGGPERAALERQILDLGLSGAVSLLGMRVDVTELLPCFDIAVLSSDFEGTPLAVMEYMEAARPIVSTRVGGVPDLIDDGVEGLLVEPRDPPALAAAIGSLLDDPERAATLGRQAQRRRREQFDIEVAARRLEGLYRDLLAGSRR